MKDIDLERIALAVKSGAAVSLFGAGFARLGNDSSGNQLPSTTELTDEIKRLFDVSNDENVSLSDISDYADSQTDGNSKLRQHLVRRLTVCSPSKIQRDLIEFPWRSIFTTNFDDIIEQCDQSNKLTHVTPVTPQSSIPSNQTPLYYIHGRARDLLETDANPSIVISESNYIDLPSDNRDLYARLHNELYGARIVIIGGYSLRDLEIARGILSRSETLREKTYIICDPADGIVARKRLEKFGTVIPDGLEKFTLELADSIATLDEAPQAGFQFLKEINLDQSSNSIDSSSFSNLLLLGNLNVPDYLNQIRQKDGSDNFCVSRDKAIGKILDLSDAFIRRYVVSGDFGNGKTTFLSQLSVQAIERGYRVYEVKTRLSEVFGEIDQAIKSGQRAAFILDDVVRYREVAEYIGNRLNDHTILICSTRSDPDERAFKEFENKLGGAVQTIELDVLNDQEIAQWDQVLERWGYWGTRIQQQPSERISFLKKECASENRSIVLSLFRNSALADKIDRISDFFLRDKREHLVSFAGLLISSLAQGHVSWESLVTWLDIDEAKLRNDLSQSEIAGIFKGGRDWNALTSSQLAEFILRNRYVSSDRDTLVATYSKIVLRTAESANDNRSGFDFRENLKELMKFRFLTRLFGNDDGAITLISSVYNRLSQAPRIRNNPQFWLQYAMSRMEIDDLSAAEKYLESAIGLAEKLGRDYSPFQILDQRARLYLKKNASAPSRFNRTEIRQAIKDLSELTKDRGYEIIYPFRAVPLIDQFLDRWIDEIDQDIRSVISDYLKLMKSISENHKTLPRSQKGETKVLYDALHNALLVIENA